MLSNTTRLIIIHALCHLAMIVYFDLSYFLMSFLWWQWIAATAIASGYHRYYSHNSFQTGKWYEHYVNLLGMFANPGPVLTWASAHKQHHRHADQEKDPHSYIHKGWFACYTNIWGWDANIERIHTKKLFRNKTVVFYYRYYFHIITAIMASLFLIHPVLFTYVFAVPVVLAFHGYGIINILGHRGGRPRNSIIANILTAGEGWHKYHHERSKDWKNGNKWWQWDFAGLWIRAIKHN